LFGQFKEAKKAGKEGRMKIEEKEKNYEHRKNETKSSGKN
jgi:hypothetical protein